MSKPYKQQNSEVLYSNEDIPMVDKQEIGYFKELSLENDRKRIRLCTHSAPEAVLHEMLIVHGKDAYVRPHKHLAKSESVHIIEGQVDVVLFTDDGRIQQVIKMGDYSSNSVFFYRLEQPIFHTLIIRSEVLVFHETTNGPLDKETTIFAPWAPTGTAPDLVDIFISDLKKRINS